MALGMNTHLLEEPAYMDSALVKEEWDEMRLGLIQRGKLVAVLPMGISPPKRKNAASCLLWLQTHSGQTQMRRHATGEGEGAEARPGAPQSVFLSEAAAAAIRPTPEDAWHEAEFELVLPEDEDCACVR
jgi:hypothetical protein